MAMAAIQIQVTAIITRRREMIWWTYIHKDYKHATPMMHRFIIMA